MFMPLCDIADRYTILKLKHERLPQDQSIMDLYTYFTRELIGEINSFDTAIQEEIRDLIEQLYLQNAETWTMEADIRQGKMDNESSLIEVGRRTLLIRNSNKKRVDIKNKISLLVAQAYGLEKKIDHRSE